mmetsp:Transcript_7101/g.14139  ORF Transcript_7101/g.14139 Transcript_7101/m.14139 type:complete len:330 (+) Transcript_7101:3-992(+)
MTEALRLSLKRWLGDADDPSISLVPAGALGILWESTNGFRIHQDEAKIDDNRWQLAQSFFMSVGYGVAGEDTWVDWAQALVDLSADELEELLTHAFELRCWEPATLNVKYVMEYLEHLCCAECAFDEDRVVGGLGCVVNLQGRKVPAGNMSQQYVDAIKLLNMCFCRFEPNIKGRAITNSMMQLRFGPGPYAVGRQSPEPMGVEVDVVQIHVRSDWYRWGVAVLIRGSVVGVCKNFPKEPKEERVSAACAIELQPIHGPPDDDQVNQLGWMMARCVPVSTTEAKYPWEPPNAAARAVLAMVRAGACSLAEGEWGSFKALATKVGQRKAL